MIRKATLKDIATIYPMLLSEHQTVKVRSINDLRKNIKNFLVYEKEKKVIGCIAFENYSSRIAEIRSLVVRPSERNNQVATKLLKQALKRVKKGQQVFVVTSIPKFFLKKNFVFEREERYALFYAG